MCTVVVERQMRHYNVSKSEYWNQIVEADEYLYIYNLVRVVTHIVYYVQLPVLSCQGTVKSKDFVKSVGPLKFRVSGIRSQRTYQVLSKQLPLTVPPGTCAITVRRCVDERPFSSVLPYASTFSF